MNNVIEPIIPRFRNLKNCEKKYVLCGFIGLISNDSLSVLNSNLASINLITPYYKDFTSNIKNRDLENKVIINVETSLKVNGKEFPNETSFIKTLELIPIEHEHIMKLQIREKSTISCQKNKKAVVNTQSKALLIFKQMMKNFLSEKEKSKFIVDVLCVEDWELQNHILQCIKKRLKETFSRSTIPLSILQNIFSFLSPEDLMTASLVNKTWLRESRKNYLWKRNCDRLGNENGFMNLSKIIIEGTGEHGFETNWFEMYKSIKSLFFKCKPNLGLQLDFKERNFQLYDIKSIRKKMKSVRLSLKKCTTELPTIIDSSTTKRSSVNDGSILYDQNDTRQLMKPIIGQLRQFQKSEEIAIDCKPSNLVSVSDKMNKSESKLILKWISADSEHYKTLCTRDSKQVKKVWPIETCFKMTGHLDSVTAIKFDKSRMFTSSIDGSLRMWDSVNGRSIRKMYGHKGGVYCLDYYQNILISGGWDMTLIVWSLDIPFSVIKLLYGHMGSITSVKIAKINGKILSASMDGTVRIYNIGSFKLIKVIQYMARENQPSGIVDMQIEESRNLIATGHCDKSLKITDMDRTDCIYNIGSHFDIIKAIYFQANMLISGGHLGYLEFWDTSTLTPINHKIVQIQVLSEKHQPVSVDSMFYHFNSLWTGHGDGSIKEWHLGSMTCIRTLYGHKGSIKSLYLFDNVMGSASLDGSVRVWKLSNSNTKNIADDKDQKFKERVPISCVFK